MCQARLWSWLRVIAKTQIAKYFNSGNLHPLNGDLGYTGYTKTGVLNLFVMRATWQIWDKAGGQVVLTETPKVYGTANRSLF